MTKFNEYNPTVNWTENEKYEFCKWENKWLKELTKKRTSGARVGQDQFKIGDFCNPWAIWVLQDQKVSEFYIALRYSMGCNELESVLLSDHATDQG